MPGLSLVELKRQWQKEKQRLQLIEQDLERLRPGAE